VREGVYVKQPIADKYFLTDFNEEIDLNNVFAEYNGNPFSINLIGNTNPSIAGIELNGSILSISGWGGIIDETTVSVQAVSGDFSVTEDFKIMISDPQVFQALNEGMESETFPPPFWSIKYNTAEDGGLNGASLIDPPSSPKWQLNDASTQGYGADYIHSGNNSALIKFWAPDFNWLIMPEMQLDYNDYTLNFWIWYSSSFYETKFHVLVDDGTKGWNSILAWNVLNPDNLFESEVSLSLADYAGKTIRIAFVYEYSDGYEMALDDIRIESPSGIENTAGEPKEIALDQNYPNPFNPSTKISFSLPGTSMSKLVVYNHKGEFVKSVFEGMLEKGNHSYEFDGSDLTSGIYFYKLETNESSYLKKMIMLK
jgi:hypothetical protein